jgi:hypothetical protein
LAVLAVLAAFVTPGTRRDAQLSVPVDAVAGILEAFRTHDIVALGEGAHGNEQGAAFRVTLVRDTRFAAAVDVIVVITMSRLSKALCADAGYMKTRRERIALAGSKPDLDRLNAQCGP